MYVTRPDAADWSVCAVIRDCVYVAVIVGIRGVFEISGVARLSAERRQEIYRSEVCVKCEYLLLLIHQYMFHCVASTIACFMPLIYLILFN